VAKTKPYRPSGSAQITSFGVVIRDCGQSQIERISAAPRALAAEQDKSQKVTPSLDGRPTAGSVPMLSVAVRLMAALRLPGSE